MKIWYFAIRSVSSIITILTTGTDTNYPWTNQFGIDEADAEYFQEVSDTRFMVVCFVEPIFNPEYPFLKNFVQGDVPAVSVIQESDSTAPSKKDAPTKDTKSSGSRGLKEVSSNSVTGALLAAVNYVGILFAAYA